MNMRLTNVSKLKLNSFFIASKRPSTRCPKHACLLGISAFAFLGLAVGCGGGSGSPPGPVAPSNLAYPHASISAMVGQAITPDVPTVTGTVTSYSINPALPAGLALNTGNGTIWGTPSASAAQASYTVSAQNTAGSTSAVLQVTVSVEPPSNLVYPQTTIKASVGAAIAPDIPTFSQLVTSFTSSPALPQGLTLDKISGSISGTPVQGTPQTVFTISASNPAGSATAQVIISVTQSSKVLLELSHGATIVAVKTAGDRVLSEDISGHWNLWGYTSGEVIASGDGAVVYSPGVGKIDMAGPVAVVGTTNTIQILSPIDGSVTASIPNPGPLSEMWWELATDGSYICTGSATGLTVWSTAGQQLFTRPGDYRSASFFPAPTEVQVGNGPEGANVIETVAVPSGADSISSGFNGGFYSWFNDGQHFLTTQSTSAGTNVLTYSNAVVQQGLIAVPYVYTARGVGNWIWIQGVTTTQVYAIGANTPTTLEVPFTLCFGPNFPPGLDSPSESYVALCNLPSYPANITPMVITIMDLSGTQIVDTSYNLQPGAWPRVGSVSSATQWVVGDTNGFIVDGGSLSKTTASTDARFFGYGVPLGLAAAPNLVAVDTDIGEILLLDDTGAQAAPPIGLWANPIALSSDGSVLGGDSGFFVASGGGNAVNFYSLPSENLIYSLQPTLHDFEGVPEVVDFSMSASGNAAGIADHFFPEQTSYPKRYVVDMQGNETPLDSSLSGPLYLSPDGSLVAAVNEWSASSFGVSNEVIPTTTNIYNNGTLVTTLTASGEGWIDNNHLLASTWKPDSTGTLVYAGSVIYSDTGAVVTTIPALPQIGNPQFPTTDTVFDAGGTNGLYSLTTGALIWLAPPGSSGCAVSGSNVVCQNGHQIVLYPD